MFKKIPKKYHPKGFEILYEDRDVIVGNKADGYITVAALWNKDHTIHSALNAYVRKGNPKSSKCVYVVHRLDQDTTGILIFAKSEQAQIILKNNWKSTVKTYYAVVHGRFAKKSGTISSYLFEDEEHMMHSTSDRTKGKLAQTAYVVLKETDKFSLLKIDLLTGRKNQIRIHLAEERHPVVGDTKYGKSDSKHKRLALHSGAISFTHPFNGQRLTFEAVLPEHFQALVEPFTIPAAI